MPNPAPPFPSVEPVLLTPRRRVVPRGARQCAYIRALGEADLVFALGPAGCGKSWLAAAAGLAALQRGQVEKLILARPALEAGEKIGFLPGQMREKADPWLKPLTDALQEFLAPDQLAHYMAQGKIEIAPLAFMRGRQFARAFFILDEAQNCTRIQLQMALTRLGEGGQMACIGDPDASDLPRASAGALEQAAQLFEPLSGVQVVRFLAQDVQRHPLVKRMVEIYRQQPAANHKEGRNKPKGAS